MRLTFPLANIFPLAIVAGLAIGLAVEYRTQLILAKEYQTLEQQWQEMVELAAQNEQLSNRLAQANAPEPLTPDQLMELLRLRGEVGLLRRQKHELDKSRAINQQLHDSLARCLETLSETNAGATASYWPQDTWRNRGYGSPEAALQTTLWALYHGDITNWVASVADNDAQNEFKKEIQKKTEIGVMADMADEAYTLKSIQILDRQVVDNNTVVLTVEADEENGFTTHHLVMKETGGQWKFAGPQP